MSPKKFVVDENGAKVAVLLDIAEYERMLEEAEDREDIRAANEAKASGETPIPYEQARKEIERARR